MLNCQLTHGCSVAFRCAPRTHASPRHPQPQLAPQRLLVIGQPIYQLDCTSCALVYPLRLQQGKGPDPWHPAHRHTPCTPLQMLPSTVTRTNANPLASPPKAPDKRPHYTQLELFRSSCGLHVRHQSPPLLIPLVLGLGSTLEHTCRTVHGSAVLALSAPHTHHHMHHHHAAPPPCCTTSLLPARTPVANEAPARRHGPQHARGIACTTMAKTSRSAPTLPAPFRR